MNKKFAVKDGDFKMSSWTGKHSFCVQVAITAQGIAVRDSKDSEKTTLFYTREEWDAFIKGVKEGQFDL